MKKQNNDIKTNPHSNKKYCVYFHYTLDNYKLFYVGYGIKKRANDNNSRNKDWNELVTTSGGYYVGIFENKYDLSIQEALDWEKYFIKKYGRIKYETKGILVNKSVGGYYGAEGSTHNMPLSLKEKLQKINSTKTLSPDTKQKISEANKGKKLTKNHKKNISVSKKGVIYSFERNNKISLSQKGIKKNNNKIIIQYDLEGNFIKEWRSVSEAKKEINNNKGDGIGSCCRNKQKTAYGFIWKFK